MAHQDPSLEMLQDQWKEMYQVLLPEAARSKSPAQPQWPVILDHCFARIILDHTVGINTPWSSKIKSPAYKNMSATQLEASINLGKKILKGNADLWDLDNRSLGMRGKPQKGGVKAGVKRKRDGHEEEVVEVTDSPEKRSVVPALSSSPATDHAPDEQSPYFTNAAAASEPTAANKAKGEEDFTPYLKKIAISHKTPFQKKVLALLCQIPRGRYTTYAAISNHLSSSPRAVGNAIRNNPFAPQVPCHRVLASGGGIGGFHGSWGRNGQAGLNDDRKRKLLRDEGVRFDGAGKAVGAVWVGFK